jgi:CBS domain containing-hemolysin-like protein
MIWAAGLFLIGLILSAFFSGSETGLYRVSRTRLVLDGLSGSVTAKAVVELLNRPALFVATTLIGNNVANYLTSFAVVMAVTAIFGAGSTVELLGPMLMTPLVFVFGELLPKYFFYHAPYRLLSAVRPLLLAVTALCLPISMLLGLLGVLLSWVTGQTPFRTKLAMARSELDQLLTEGHEAGILGAGQKLLAQNIFEVGNQAGASFGVPPERLAIVDAPVDVATAVQQARRRNHPIVLVRDAGRIIGYLRYADLCVGQPPLELKPVIHARVADRHLSVLLRLYDSNSEVAVLLDEQGNFRQVVTRRQLLQPLVK